MIKELNIKNFAIIDSLKIKFDKNFNVITGETGAGKTLVIKAIDILLGGKFNKKMIRNSIDDVEISAKIISNNQVIDISRVYKNDKSYSTVNNKRVSLADVLNHFSCLVQFQRQHDSNDLLDSNKHISILDSYVNDNQILDEVKKLFDSYIENKKKYDEIINNAETYSDKLNLYNFQIEELNSVILDTAEELKLNKKYKKYINSKDIIDAVNEYVELNDAVSFSPINNIEKSIKSLSKFQLIDEEINSSVSRLEDILVELKDIKEDMSRLDSKYHFNQDEKNLLEKEILKYEEIKRK